MAREPGMTNAVGAGTVQWDLDGRGVGTVTLNRPEVNNAYNGDLIRGLHEALDALGASPGLRVVVLRGNGKHFQAGADLTWLAEIARQSPEENERVSRATAESVRRLDTLPLPMVALDPATLEIDKQATDEERARRAGAGPLIDRGPGFDEAEARWRATRP